MPPPRVASLAGPFASLNCMHLKILEEVEVAKRQGFRVSVTPRPVLSDFQNHGLWDGADEYELIIDAEIGVCLGLIQYYKGEEVSREEIREIVFHEPLPEVQPRWSHISDVVRLLHTSRDSFETLHAVIESSQFREQEKLVEAFLPEASARERLETLRGH